MCKEHSACSVAVYTKVRQALTIDIVQVLIREKGWGVNGKCMHLSLDYQCSKTAGSYSLRILFQMFLEILVVLRDFHWVSKTSEQPVKESDRLETDARWGLFLCCHGLYDVFEYVTLELEYLTKLNSYCPSLSIDTIDYVIGIGHNFLIFFLQIVWACGMC